MVHSNCAGARGAGAWTIVLALALAWPLAPARGAGLDATDGYRLQPGDLIEVSVWREADLQRDVLVRPDGGISLPLIGEVSAARRTVEALRVELEQRLRRFIPEAAVSVAIREARGNVVYVLGKVARPGEFQVGRGVDVMQALSMAGGTTTFADLDRIVVLRREGETQTVLEFNYEEAARGVGLERNVLLRSGDVVVVP